MGASVKASALKQLPRARRGRHLLLPFFIAVHIGERDDLGFGQLNSLVKPTTQSRLWHSEPSLGNSGRRLFTADRVKPLEVGVMSASLLARPEHVITAELWPVLVAL